jgi:hypothetical protein
VVRLVICLLCTWCRLTDRASAAATWPLAHYPTFLTPEAPASCMPLLGANPEEVGFQLSTNPP